MTPATIRYLLTLAREELERREHEYARAMIEHDIVHEVQVTAERRLAEARRAVRELEREGK